MNKTVLVTGASGFIGRHTVSTLEKGGMRVIRGVRNPPIGNNTEECVHIELNNPRQILALEETLHCDTIVHLAARVGWTGESDSDLYVSNVLSSGCIAYLARCWNAHLVFASAAIVHGIRAECIRNNSPLTPDTSYGRSKLLAEQLIQYSGANSCVLRFAGVFGTDGPPHLGLNRAITAIRQGICPTQIGSGQALRNYVYVKDVASTIASVIKTNLTGVHLVASDQTLSINQMLQELCDTFLPGKEPIMIDGPEATDQIVTPSPFIPKTRSFQEALRDIQKEGYS